MTFPATGVFYSLQAGEDKRQNGGTHMRKGLICIVALFICALLLAPAGGSAEPALRRRIAAGRKNSITGGTAEWDARQEY